MKKLIILLCALLSTSLTFGLEEKSQTAVYTDTLPEEATEQVDTNLRFTANGVAFEMIFVEGGTFVMGCTSEQSNCGDDEKPTHSVTLPNYYMGQFEVTQALWQAVMGTSIRQQQSLSGASSLYGEGNEYPMYYINHSECEEFCAKLNRLLAAQLPEGYTFYLPTEAQWEYAARGGKKSRGYQFSGSNDLSEVAWYFNNSSERINDSFERPHEVGTKEKNELGLYDMSGNVWEWCSDWYGSGYYSSSPSHNPKGPSSASDRVLRGGSWGSRAQGCRVAYRGINTPSSRISDYGFRLALVP